MEATGAVAEKAPAPLHLMFFADAYANWQSAQPGTSAPWHRAYDSSAFGNGSQNGFSLAFTGLDVSYVGTGWGATTSLRFGPAPLCQRSCRTAGAEPVGLNTNGGEQSTAT